MYERNAIVIDRYFASIFGYDKNNNLKNNSSNYFELVSSLEKYQKASETENNIMAEFEKVANRIRETQKLQEVLNKRNLKYSETRKSLFEGLEEDADTLKEKFEKIEEEINKNNQEIKENSDKFIEEIIEFNEKSETRSDCGKERRIVENDYQKVLKTTTDIFNNINKDKLKEIKAFVKSDNKDDAKQEIKEKILKNGAKEKVPFDINAITSAIDVSVYIEEKKAEILLSLYDKTMKLLDEIKNDTVKIDKHKKIVKDAKSKLEFLSVISEYIILFLDNERMNTMGGLEEHQKSMNEACSNLQKDLIEIQNMYSLLIKEMTGKSSKKAYKELYNLEYLLELQQNEKEFAESISKINMIGTVVYPDYWRVEGMQKMYDTFKHILTEVYEKDLSEYEPLDITFSVNEEVLNTEDNTETADEGNAENTNKQEDENGSDKEGNTVEKNKEDEKDGLEEDLNVAEDNDDEEFHWDDDDEDDELIFENNSYILREDEKEDSEEDDDNSVEEKGKQQEIDKEIDEILGFFDSDDAIEDEEDDDETPLELEEDDLEEKIFEDKYEEEVEEQDDKEDKKKRKGLFARRNK